MGISDAAAIFGPTGVALVQALDGRTWLFTSKKSEPILLTSDNLLGVEILIDGVSVHQARRGRPLSEKMLTAVTSGDASAIIATSDVPQINIEDISKISMLMHMNLKRRSELELIIWDTHNRTMSTDLARQFKDNALEWSARLEVVMSGSDESGGARDGRLTRIQQLTQRREAGLITHLSSGRFNGRLLTTDPDLSIICTRRILALKL